jgi:hypothetical protein
MLLKTSTLLMMERQSKSSPQAVLKRGDVVLVPFPNVINVQAYIFKELSRCWGKVLVEE